MGTLMDLVAGETREILLAVATDDWRGLCDRTRFAAHLDLGAGLDPGWLDLFSRAARSVSGGNEPRDFLAACMPLEGPADVGERTVERVDRAWLEAVARTPDHELDAVAGCWVDLLGDQLGEGVSDDDKPWLRSLAGEIVRFARTAVRAPDVLFAWSP